jgi:hypothetical protein
MAIASFAGVEIGDLYTTTGKDVWRVEALQRQPVLTMKNQQTGETRTGHPGDAAFTDFKTLIVGA